MSILQDILVTNRKIIPKSLKLIAKNWPIIFTGVIYAVVLMMLWSVARWFSILAGIIITLVQSALISNYLYLIENIVRYGKINLEDFKQGFQVYIWKVYGILVVIWFVNYGADIFLRPLLNINIGFVSLWMIVQLVAVILLNSLPEVIYQKHYSVGESFSYAFEFIKENWIDWFVPNVLLFALLIIVAGKSLLFSIVPGLSMLSLSLPNLIINAIGQLILAYIMIYRGLLFNVLNTTTRRKRLFMRNIN